MSEQRSIGRRIFEAYQNGTGVHFTDEDVRCLIAGNDPLGAAISDAAWIDGGGDPDGTPGTDCGAWAFTGTWEEFCRYMTGKDGE